MLSTRKKPPISWRINCCGGIECFGKDECILDPRTNEMSVCACPGRANNFNYYAHYLLLVQVTNTNCHLTRNENSWNQVADICFAEGGPFEGNKPVVGKYKHN